MIIEIPYGAAAGGSSKSQPRPSASGELGEVLLSRLLPRPDLVDYTVKRLDFLTYHDRVNIGLPR